MMGKLSGKRLQAEPQRLYLQRRPERLPMTLTDDLWPNLAHPLDVECDSVLFEHHWRDVRDVVH